MKASPSIYSLALAGAGLLAGVAGLHGANPPATVQVAHPFKGEITRSIMLPAVVRPEQETVLYAKVTGYVKSIGVDIGDHISTGQTVAELEVPELEAELARNQAELAKLKADLKKTEAELAASEIEYQRLGEAAKRSPDLVVAQQVDDSKAKRDVAKASEGMVQADQNVVAARIRQTQTLLHYAKITAPFGGVITKRWVDTGALVPAATSGSSPKSSAVVTISDFSKVRVQVAVPQPEVPNVANDLPVQVLVDELPGRSFTGKITRFAYALEEATKTMSTEIELANADNALRPGMFATVKIGIQKHLDTLLVPVDAILAEKTKNSVFIVEGGKAKKVPVKTGFEDGKRVEILEGITAAQMVIISGKQAVNDGDTVNAAEAK